MLTLALFFVFAFLFVVLGSFARLEGITSKAEIATMCQFCDDDMIPIGHHQHIDCHMVFDVKTMLEREAYSAVDGHQTEPAKT